jgi:hypothetical protein
MPLRASRSRPMSVTLAAMRPSPKPCSQPQRRRGFESGSSQVWLSPAGGPGGPGRGGNRGEMRFRRLVAVAVGSRPFLAMQKVVGSSPIIRSN